LYGTTAKGGRWGYGTVFKLDTAGVETVLHSFAGYRRNGGSQPLAGLVRDSQGNLYGTTNLGGIVSGACAIGCGLVFKLAP
ncbi:MAG TPA: choice-of-anchor tandem repeat GloVer-containing protein, partial [Bryobacteraceae bacterium]|nr:choice-of-anchor tandem repeat GloVer-containing protein [Bryobacteraceae bacterium]